MSTALADPNAARAHARAMEGTVVAAMPVLPPRADDLPAEISSGDLLWEETIAAGGYASRLLARGTRLISGRTVTVTILPPRDRQGHYLHDEGRP